MKARESRFVGTGNTWIGDGRYRGWRITCNGCGAVKTITNHNDRTIPPNIVVKKLLQSGWYLGHKPEEDMCVACRRKKPTPGNGSDNKPLPPLSKAALTAEYFCQIGEMLMHARLAIKTGQLNRAVGIIDTVRGGLERVSPLLTVKPDKPEKVAPPPRSAPPVPESADDYSRWLAELDKDKET